MRVDDTDGNSERRDDCGDEGDENAADDRRSPATDCSDRQTADQTAADESDAARAATRVVNSREPTERITKDLLDALRGGSVRRIESELEDTADAVTTATIIDNVETSPQAAQTAVEDARRELSSSSLPTSAERIVGGRLDDLRRQLEVAVDSEPLTPYAVRLEAEFYR
ncbi:MAG: hypothetical protein J07HB67_01141, partial [halophilic archaeon J07HB67]